MPLGCARTMQKVRVQGDDDSEPLEGVIFIYVQQTFRRRMSILKRKPTKSWFYSLFKYDCCCLEQCKLESVCLLRVCLVRMRQHSGERKREIPTAKKKVFNFAGLFLVVFRHLNTATHLIIMIPVYTWCRILSGAIIIHTLESHELRLKRKDIPVQNILATACFVY